MDHTHHPPAEGDAAAGPPPEPHPIDNLAALDPAEAPEAAEEYAQELAAELEEAGAATEPVQLQADLEDSSGSTPGDSP